MRLYPPPASLLRRAPTLSPRPRASERSPRRGVLLAVLLAVFAQGFPASADDKLPAPLLRILEQRFEHGRQVASDEVIVLRDGVVVTRRAGADGGEQILRGQAREDEIAELATVLAEQRVGVQTARCRIGDLPAALPATPARGERRTLISWFGRGGRDRHLEISSSADRFGDACHDALRTLALRTLEFSRGVHRAERAEPPLERSLLFALDSSMRTHPECTPYAFVERTYLFRDGMVLRLIEDSRDEYLIERAEVEAETMAALRQTLLEQRVGFQGGACRIWFFLPFVLEERCIEPDWASTATWHGRGSRRSVLRGHRHLSRTCSREQAGIRQALLGALIEAVGDPSAARVTGTFSLH